MLKPSRMKHNRKVYRNNPGPYVIPAPKKRKRGRPKGTTKNDINLTEKEQLFCDMILENMHKENKIKLSNTECFRKAFGKWKMKENVAQVSASQLIKKQKIHRYLQDRKKAAAGRVELTQAKVLRGLLRIVHFDIRKLVDHKGNFLPIDKIDDDTALAISSIETKPITKRLANGRTKIVNVIKKITTEKKKPTYELLGTHLDMWTGDSSASTPQDFVNGVRDFAQEILGGIPGGEL